MKDLDQQMGSLSRPAENNMTPEGTDSGTVTKDAPPSSQAKAKRRGRKKRKADENLTHDLSQLALAKQIDDRIIEMGIDDDVLELDYRRKRSLKFRAKQRKQRAETFGDAFHKQDRSFKSLNKVLAAKRRKRDGQGKFNLEAKKEIIFTAIDESQYSTEKAVSFKGEKEVASAALNL